MKTVRALILVSLFLCATRFSNAQVPDSQIQLHREQLRIAVQAICPVTGEKLGEHGAPIKATIGNETVFLCCADCLKEKVNDQHWATIHSNIAKAQGICPVMKKALPDNPKSTIVEGQVVYVCCPPCGKKIAANTAKFLGQVDQQYAAALNEAESLQRN